MLSVNRPRKLSDAEIKEITKVISLNLLKSIDLDSAEILLQNIHESLYRQLENIKLTPLAIPDMKNMIYESFTKALRPMGESVGLLAVSALIAPIMQLTLNAFHSAGSGNVVSTGSITQILTATKNPKDKYIRAIFNQHITMDDLFKFTNKYVNVTLEMLVTKHEIINSHEIFYNEDQKRIVYPYWYYNFQTLINPKLEITESTYMVRLNINVGKMFKYRINPDKLYENLINHDYKIPNPFIIVMSPIIKGEMFIDFYPNIDNIIKNSNYCIDVDVSSEDVIFDFMELTFIKNLNHIHVHGYDNITDFLPVNFKVWDLVNNVVDLENGLWKLYLNLKNLNNWGIKLSVLDKLLEWLKIEVVEKTEKYYITKGNNPEKILNDAEKADKVEKNTYETQKKTERFNLISLGKDASGILTLRPDSELEKLNKAPYLKLNGYNLRKINNIPEIDPYHTYSNDMHELFQMYGIEAVRNYVIMRMREIIDDSGEYIDIHHIILHADLMTHLGFIVTFNYTGMNSLDIGAFAASIYQRPVDVLSTAASIGKTEEIVPSTSILVSHPSGFGTAYKSEISVEDAEFIRKRYGEPYTGKVDLNLDNLIGSVDTSMPEFVVEEDDYMAQLALQYGGEDVSEDKPIGTIITKDVSNILLGGKVEPNKLWQSVTIYSNYSLTVKKY